MAENKPRYHVFLSHNSRDKGSVEPLAFMLSEMGLNPFLDKWNLVPGEPIEDALIEALENSDSAAIFVGPGGEGPWQSEEMRDILKRAVKSHNEFRAIPVLLPDASAEALERSFLGSRLWIEFKDVDDDDALLRLAKAIQGEAYGDESFKLPDEPAPYRGLERFERIEKPEEDFFFGRDDEIRVLIERLVKDSFVAVVGASGSGKSSLIRAGLTKQLAEDLQPGIRRWQTITVEPGSAPFRALAVQIAVAAGIGVAEREDWIEKSVPKWRASADGMRQSLETLFADAREPLLVFIDQFEELFTHGKKNEEHERITRNFVANLDDLWRNGGDRVRVVVAMRADFIDRCLEIGALKELLQDRTMLIGEVGDDALREIVKEPAARVGAFLEKGLMERILTDVHNQSGSLPLLEQALHELWRQRRGAWLTHDAYDDSGGVAGALNDQAQGAYKSLDDAQKKIADGLFPRLITLGEGVADTRRRVRRNELYPEGVEPDAVNAVIDKLSAKDSRILVTTREGGTVEDIGAGEDFVEFTHEALLGNWQHLVDLLASERESIRKHRVLTTAAEEWESKPEAEREKFLLRAGQLVIAEQWADEGGYARLNQQERRFLDESTQERDAEEARKAQDARRLKRLAMGATAAAAIAIGVGVVAFGLKEKAETQARIAHSGRLASASLVARINRPDLASLLALEAFNLQDTFDSRNSILMALQSNPGLETFFHHKDRVIKVIFGLDGMVAILSGPSSRGEGFEGRVQLWKFEASGATPLGKPLEGRVSSVFVRDGVLATLSKDGTVRFWKLGGSGATPLGVPLEGQVKRVAFNPNGTLATLYFSDTVQLWQLGPSGATPLGEPLKIPGEPHGIALGPDRVLAASDGDGTVRLWKLGASGATPLGKSLESLGGPGILAFGPEGDLAVAGYEGVRIWRVGKSGVTPLIDAPGGRVMSVAFSPDGTLAAGGRDGTVRLWKIDALDAKPLGELVTGHEGVLETVALSPGNLLATGGRDGTVRLWSGETPLGSRLERQYGGVYSVAWGPDGTLASGGADGTVLIQKPGMSAVTRWTGHKRGRADARVKGLAFGPNGILASGGSDGTVRLWKLGATGATSLGGPLTDHAGHCPERPPCGVNSVAFGPDGTLASAGEDEMIRLWRLGAAGATQFGEPLKLPGVSGVTSVAFSPDGTLAAANWLGTVQLWRLETTGATPLGEPMKDGRGMFGGVVAFGPDQVLASAAGGGDTTVRLWKVQESAANPHGEPLAGELEMVEGLAVSPDGTLAAGGSDGKVRLWKLGASGATPLGEPLAGQSGGVTGLAFGPGGNLVSAHNSGAVWLWNLDIESWRVGACRRANRNLSLADWRKYMVDTPYRLTCPGLPPGEGAEISDDKASFPRGFLRLLEEYLT